MAPEGPHTLDDGRTITVDAEGVITEVQDAGDGDEEDNAEALQARNAELEAQVAQLQADLEAKNTELETTNQKLQDSEAKLSEVVSDVTELKGQMEVLSLVIPGDPKNVTPKGDKKEIPAGMTEAQAKFLKKVPSAKKK